MKFFRIAFFKIEEIYEKKVKKRKNKTKEKNVCRTKKRKNHQLLFKCGKKGRGKARLVNLL